MKLFNQTILTLSLYYLFAISVSAADEFVPNDQPIGYIQPMAMSTFNLADGAKGYRPWFENGAWQGDLIEYSITKKGAISTTIDLSGIEPINSGSNWSARLQFNKAEETAEYWKNSRKIITHDGTNQVAFVWGNLSITQKKELDLPSQLNASSSSPILDYVRGDRQFEKPNGDYRKRYNLLGDIIHSNPVYVGAPASNIASSSYVKFQNDNANRAPRVYVGANDGMLHVFDAKTGNEVYAFIPPTLIGKLDNLASDPYFHEYYVDGEISVQDAYFSGKWHTVLIGSLGAGGTARFALDITNPNLSSQSSNSGGDNKVLWIKDELSSSALGYSYGNANVALLANGKYYTVAGNGYNSGSSVAQLILTNIATGAISKINTNSGSIALPNGLSTPALIDENNDGTFDFAYAGDLNGNMWKFDLAKKSVVYSKPIHSGGRSLPITTKPSITTHPYGGKLVFFATGKILDKADLNDTTNQAVFGIWDNGTSVPSANLRTQILSSAKTHSSQSIKTLTNKPIDWDKHTGWKIALELGERVVTNHQLRDGRIQLVVTNPTNSENWLLEPSYLTGGAPKQAIFDIDGNGSLELADNISSSPRPVNVAAAWQVSSGVMSGPVIAKIDNGVDTKFVNFEELGVAPIPCTEGCGFLGGHIDVDTDSPSGLGNGFAEETSAHTHEYDKKVSQPYVDYFQVNQGDAKQLQADEIIADSKQFFVVVANADLSSSSELHIGNRTYNVLEYQKMVHQQLAKLGNAGDIYDLVDNEGNSLIVSIGDFKDADGNFTKGTIRNSFDNHSIIDGGLHPTQTGCVKKETPNYDDDHPLYDRWRNGALITQLIDPERVKSLADLYIQNPNDLPTSKKTSNGEVILKPANGVIYGGLRAKGNTNSNGPANGMLYESTLFWHYGAIVKYKEKELGGSEKAVCYGDNGWEKSVASEREGITQLEYEQILDKSGFESFEQLDDEINAIRAKCVANNTAKCDDAKGDSGKKLKDLVKLHDKAAWVIENRGEGGADDIPTGIPLSVIGGNTSTGVTAGPNFIQGRRTWIDITNQ